MAADPVDVDPVPVNAEVGVGKTEDAEDAMTFIAADAAILLVDIDADSAVGTASPARTPVTRATITLCAICTAREGWTRSSGLLKSASSGSAKQVFGRAGSVEHVSHRPLQQYAPPSHSRGIDQPALGSAVHDIGAVQHSLHQALALPSMTVNSVT